MIARLFAPVALLLGTAASAQQSLPTPQPVVAEPLPAAARPALWKVSSVSRTALATRRRTDCSSRKRTSRFCGCTFTSTAGCGLPPAAFDRFKPWYAAVVLATLPLQRNGYSLANGVETELATRNAAQRRPRIGLETREYQLALFDDFPAKVQRRYLFTITGNKRQGDRQVGRCGR